MEKPFSELESEFISKFNELNIPGGVFALVSQDEILWKKTLGHTDLSMKREVDEKSLFCLQSTTKTITALCFLLAQQEGFASNLRKLGKEESANQIEALKPDR